ncbi:MAG: hypothetical protein H7235_00205, partial [Bdellovibrionaceae bacterium]|nr:hypothetical protein [Pseudobdellovibrionaceae bacterium]
DFKPLVEAVREEIDRKSEMTQTVQTSVTPQKATTTAELSGTITGAHRVDFSQVEMPGLPVESPAPDLTTELPKKEINRKIMPPPSPNNSISDEKPKLSLGPKWLVAAIVMLLCVAGSWYYYVNFSENKNEKTIFQQIRKYNLYAQDDKSIELFKKLPLASQDKIAVDIIPLWLKLEAAGALSSSRMLDYMTKGKVIGNERKSQYQLVKFNKAFNLGDVQNARDSLVKATDLDPSSVDVKENDALLLFAQKKYTDSARIFKNLYDVSSQGRYLYGYVLSQINAKAINGPVVYQLLENHIHNRIEFNKEILFLQIYMIKKGLVELPDQYRNHFELFIDFPHQMTKYFKLSSLINRTSYNWEDLEGLRQELVPLMDHRDAILLNVNFYLEKSDITQAQDLYYKNQNILSENDIYNLDVAFAYFKKTYQTVLKVSIEGKIQSLASQLYMLMIHIESKSGNSTIMQYINMLMKDKKLFSNWSLLMTAKMPEDKEQMKMLINSDRLYSNEFLPYLEFKSMANND